MGHFLISRSSNSEILDGQQDAEKNAYIKGLKYIISNEPDKAIAEFTRAVQINTNTVEIYLNLGNLFREKGELERAIRIHQSILLRPNLSSDIKESALMNLGLDYSAAGIFDRAIQTFQQLISLRQKNLQPHRELEKIYEEQKDWEKAFIEAKTCQKLTKSDISSLLAHIITELAKDIYTKGDTSHAIKELKRAININKNCIDTYLVLGDIYFSQDKTDQAISTWEKIIHCNLPFHHLVYERLEKAYLKNGNYDNIEQIYNEIISKNPEDSITRIILAEYNYKKGLSHKSIQVLKEALKIKPKSSNLRKKLGEIILKEGHEKEALLEYQTLIGEMKCQRFFNCTRCGYQTSEVLWKCPQCKEWDTFSEKIS